jgi:hypothetical protein
MRRYGSESLDRGRVIGRTIMRTPSDGSAWR